MKKRSKKYKPKAVRNTLSVFELYDSELCDDEQVALLLNQCALARLRLKSNVVLEKDFDLFLQVNNINVALLEYSEKHGQVLNYNRVNALDYMNVLEQKIVSIINRSTKLNRCAWTGDEMTALAELLDLHEFLITNCGRGAIIRALKRVTSKEEVKKMGRVTYPEFLKENK